MGARSAAGSNLVLPKGSIRPARPWIAGVLDSAPAAAETEPIALRKALREAQQDNEGLRAVLKEKDEVIGGLMANLEDARRVGK